MKAGDSFVSWQPVAAQLDDRLAREEDARGRAMARAIGAVFQLDGAGVFADDSLGYPQSKAGAVFSLSGKEWLEEPVANVGSDSWA
jgi:hypothetical protein